MEERRAQKASHDHSRVTGHTILKAAQDNSGQAIISLTANRHGSSVFMHDTFLRRVQEEDPELQSFLELVVGRFQRLIFTGSGDTQPRKSAIAQAPAQTMFALKRLDEKTLCRRLCNWSLHYTHHLQVKKGPAPPWTLSTLTVLHQSQKTHQV